MKPFLQLLSISITCTYKLRFVVNLSQRLHVSDCKKFMEMIEEIIADSFGKTEEKDSKDALSASHLIEKLSMTEPENQTHTKEPSVANNDKRVKEDEEKKQVESEQSSSTS